MYSLVIPVYKNEASLPELIALLESLDERLEHKLEVVFVVDGSPDNSYPCLKDALPAARFRSQLVLFSRNFGSFNAIRAGMQRATGSYFAVMAADLQEPPDLVFQFFRALESEPIDVTVGTRSSRRDPFLSRVGSELFWSIYKKLIQREVPHGGVDVFGCNQRFREHLLALHESNSSLVGLIFWLGFRRKAIAYERAERQHGKSAWTFGKKFRYLMDSAIAFSDLPVTLLLSGGALGITISVLLSAVILTARFFGWIEVPGYTATALLILFFACLNSFGLGIIGSYVWRTFENTKGRPGFVIQETHLFERRQDDRLRA